MTTAPDLAPRLTERLTQAGLDWIAPVWDAPSNVHALSTSRNGGVSEGARTSLDLGGAHPAQDSQHAAVLENRRRLAQFLPAPPAWLAQVHGAEVAQVDHANMASLLSSPPTADAAVTREAGVVLGVRTADCLPVLFSDRAGTVVGAAHAGWRGLAGGVLEATLRAMRAPPQEIVAWLGPAIGPRMFEVGRDVYDAFCAPEPEAATFFAPHRDDKRLAADRDDKRLAADRDDKWLADLYGLARHRLGRAGVSAVAGGGHCTLTEADRFFSWRREKDAGRMATLIWLGPRA
jgi:YfiH family protein